MDSEQAAKHRPHYLTQPQFYRLNQACRAVEEAFPSGLGTYLVGSSLERADFRDVDVRVILEDEEFRRLFPSGVSGPFWSLLCASISLHLSQQTGLPIDFQIQQMTEANTLHPGPGKRNALGVNLLYGWGPMALAPLPASEPESPK